MAKMPYGQRGHKSKIVKGIKNGRPEEYIVIIWTNNYDTSDPSASFYSLTWQLENNVSWNAGYGTEVRTNMKTLATANKAMTALAAKIRKQTTPFK